MHLPTGNMCKETQNNYKKQWQHKHKQKAVIKQNISSPKTSPSG
jgi:hypothetical protein